MGSVTCGPTLWFCDAITQRFVLVVGSVLEIKLRLLGAPHRLLAPSGVFVATSQDSTVGVFV